jgi:hypothetical protein
MQDANIQMSETLGHKPPETLADLLKSLIAAGVDAKEFAHSLLLKAKQYTLLKKSLTDGERQASLQKAKAYLFLAEALLKASQIVEADASKDAHLAAPATERFDKAHQKINRNIAPAQAELGSLLNKGAEPNAGDMARCARYCKDEKGRDIQGRNCPVCLGAGHSKARSK